MKMVTLSVFFIGFSAAWYLIRASELLRLKSPSRLQRLLGFILLWWGISTMKDIVIHMTASDTSVLLRHIMYVDACGALSFALMLMELTMPNWITLRRVVCMALPFLAFLTVHLWVSADWLDTLFTVFFVTFALIMVGIAIVKSRHYGRAIRNSYSNLSDLDINWMWNVIAVFTACQLIWWAVCDGNDPVADTIYYVSALLCWAITLYHINHMRPFRKLYDIGESGIAVSDDMKTSKKYIADIDDKMERVIEKEKPYLNPDITLSDLAACLNTNRTYLSEYLSTQLETNFYDYINSLRIRHALRLIKEHPNYTMEHIACQSGFKSITTFRRSFKKYTGMLPSEFYQQHISH